MRQRWDLTLGALWWCWSDFECLSLLWVFNQEILDFMRNILFAVLFKRLILFKWNWNSFEFNNCLPINNEEHVHRASPLLKLEMVHIVPLSPSWSYEPSNIKASQITLPDLGACETDRSEYPYTEVVQICVTLSCRKSRGSVRVAEEKWSLTNPLWQYQYTCYPNTDFAFNGQPRK